MSAKRPSTCGRMASRSKQPAVARASGPLAADMQKWFDQNCTSRSTKPTSARTARWKRASASARSSFCSTGGSGCLGLLRWRHGRSRAIARSRHRRISSAVFCHGRVGVRGSCHLRRRRLRGAVLARNPHALPLRERGLQRGFRLRQRRRIQVRDAGLHQLGLEEAARIGGGTRQIAGVGAAAGPECEAVEGDKASLGIGTNCHVFTFPPARRAPR